MALGCNIEEQYLAASLHVKEANFAGRVLGELDVRDDGVLLIEAQNFSYLLGGLLVHHDTSDTFLLVLHIDEMLAVEVKRHTILVEHHTIWSILL